MLLTCWENVSRFYVYPSVKKMLLIVDLFLFFFFSLCVNLPLELSMLPEFYLRHTSIDIYWHAGST